MTTIRIGRKMVGLDLILQNGIIRPRNEAPTQQAERQRALSVGSRIYNGGTTNPGNTAADFQTLEHRQRSVPEQFRNQGQVDPVPGGFFPGTSFRQDNPLQGSTQNPPDGGFVPGVRTIGPGDQFALNTGAGSPAPSFVNAPAHIDPTLTSRELEFNPQYAELIRTLRNNMQQIIADRQVALERNQQDVGIAGEDITRSRGRAARANQADLASRGILDGDAARTRTSELHGDYDRAIRDVGLQGIRNEQDVLSGSLRSLNDVTADINSAQLNQARDALLARLGVQENNARAAAQTELARQLSQLLQSRAYSG